MFYSRSFPVTEILHAYFRRKICNTKCRVRIAKRVDLFDHINIIVFYVKLRVRTKKSPI